MGPSEIGYAKQRASLVGEPRLPSATPDALQSPRQTHLGTILAGMHDHADRLSGLVGVLEGFEGRLTGQACSTQAGEPLKEPPPGVLGDIHQAQKTIGALLERLASVQQSLMSVA